MLNNRHEDDCQKDRQADGTKTLLLLQRYSRHEHLKIFLVPISTLTITHDCARPPRARTHARTHTDTDTDTDTPRPLPAILGNAAAKATATACMPTRARGGKKRRDREQQAIKEDNGREDNQQDSVTAATAASREAFFSIRRTCSRAQGSRPRYVPQTRAPAEQTADISAAIAIEYI
jgi:hypothetical protein